MKFFQGLTILLTVALTAGCAMNNGAREDVRDNNNTRIQNYDQTDRGARILDDNLNGNNNDVQMRVHEDVKNKIEDLKEVRRAHVIVTDHTAYVAVVLNNDETGNNRKDLENKISDKVKATDKSIDNVYVSSNPDFVDRMSDYGNQIQNGQPVRGLYDQFKEMVQRVFPSAR